MIVSIPGRCQCPALAHEVSTYVIDKFTLDQNWLDTGRTFKRAYDALLLSSDEHKPSTDDLVSALQTVYREDGIQVETELMAEENTSDDTDAALPSRSIPDPYEELKQMLQNEEVIGTIGRGEGAVELALSLARAMGLT